MAIIYRTDGAWGTGQGSNLSPAQVDGNFYDITTRVTYIEDNPVEPVVPIAINIEGSAFTMGLSNGETLGPIAITMPMPTWRGDWNPSVAYNELDFFIAPDNGLGAVMIPHTSAATFDWGALDDAAGGTGLPVYRQLIGGSGTTSGISDLTDVALGTQADNDMLVWDGPASLWRNETPAAVTVNLPAFGGATGSAAGAKGVVPAPAAGDNTAGKFLSAAGGWAVPPSTGGGSGSLAGLADVSITSPVNLSLLQYNSTDGLWHDASLTELGTGTVGLVETGAGLTGGPITTSGMIQFATVPTLNLLANVTAGAAAPAGVSLSTLLDAVVGTERGSILRRGGTGWTAITPGADGTFLRSGGPAADITWGTPSGAGTVTTVNSGAGLTGGPITSSGTLSLATVGDNNVLANISGGTAAPGGTALTLLLDHALGATRGMVLYRGATVWAALPAGASGAVLTSGGTGADPSWAAGAGAGTVTNVATGTGLIGGPITNTGTISFATVATGTVLANVSGSTAAPTPATMSAILDAVFSSTRGSVLYRGAAGWAALGAGTAGNVLTTGGAGADPSWAAAAGGASITTSDTPPSSPADGDAWWDSVGGQLYIRYDDGTSSQWVPATNQGGITVPLPVAQGGTGSTTAAAALTSLGAVPAAGGTMTGNLIIAPTSGAASVALQKPASGVGANVVGYTAANARWLVSLGNTAAESGSNAGSDFEIGRYNDAGTYISSPLTIARSTGAVVIAAASTLPLTLTNTSDGYIRYNAVRAWSVGVNTGGAYQIIDVPTATARLAIDGATGACYNQSGTWTAISDGDLKQDVVPYNRGLAAIKELQPVAFRYKPNTPFAGKEAPSDVQLGLIADQVQPHIPEIVGSMSVPVGEKGEEQTVDTLNTGQLIFSLINAVKELAAKVAALEAAK